MGVSQKEYIHSLLSHFSDDDVVGLDKKRTITKKILYEKAQSFANGLIQAGCKKGDNIAIFSVDREQFLIAYFGVLLVGGTVVVVDLFFNQTVTQNILDNANIKYIVCDKKMDLLAKYKLLRNVVYMLKGVFLIPFTNPLVIENLVDAGSTHVFTGTGEFNENNICCIIPTGGTTGKPKMVVHTYKSFLITITRIHSSIQLEGKRCLIDLPYLGVLSILLGKEAFFGGMYKNLKSTLTTLVKYNIDILFLAPVKLVGEYKIPRTVKTILLGSAPIYQTFLQELSNRIGQNTNVFGMYGMTECLPIATYSLNQKLTETEQDYLGVLCADIKATVSADGELVITSPYLFQGYLGGAHVDELYTGDVAKIDGNKLYMLGRVKNMIIKNGVNIYPGLYEGNILRIPGVVDCVMYGYAGDVGDEKIVVIAEINTKHDENIIRDKILKYKIHSDVQIDTVLIVPSIPRSGRQNKIDYKALNMLCNSLR